MDIDVLATNGAEVIIVSCKRGSLSSKQEEEEIEKFNKHEEFLRNEEKYRDFVKNLRIQKWYVAEYVSAHNRNTLQPEIKVKLLKEILDELIEMLKKEMGLNMLVGAETKVLPRLLKFMIENKLIEEEKISKCESAKIGLNSLSSEIYQDVKPAWGSKHLNSQCLGWA